MSLKAKVEIMVHIGSFRSIAMYNQGSHYCEIRFYIQTPNAQYYFKPIKREKANKKFTARESRFINNDMIDRGRRNSIKVSKRVYCTQGFTVEYNLDECNLNEYAHFSQDIDLPKVDTSEEMLDIKLPLIMECTLYVKTVRINTDVPNTHYDKATITTQKIGDIVEGIYKAVPVVFKSPYISVLNTSVHCSIQNLSLSQRSRMEMVSNGIKNLTISGLYLL